VATSLAERVTKLGPFELLSDGSEIPVFAFAMRDASKYSVFDVSDRMRQYGWQVPAYTMPADAQDLAVLRVVVREGFSADLGEMFIKHLTETTEHLERHGSPPGEDRKTPFAHT
jgi:glutamate decarboxylase